MTDSAAASFVLAVRDLQVEFRTSPSITTPAVRGVSFDIPTGKTVALVGESGSGKSVTSLALLRLIPAPGFITNGSAVLRFKDGNTVDLFSASEALMRSLRGSAIAMIFQEPMTALNPVLTVGEQISEALLIHRGSLTSKERRERAVELLRRVGIPQPDKRAREYPHTLSGGMRQRVAIAMAISCQPTLLIADEPTTALDVTIQAQILQLLRSLQEESGMSMLFITHDLRVVQSIADRVLVMKDGLVVEQGRTADVFSRPQHPYSVKLLSSMPVHA